MFNYFDNKFIFCIFAKKLQEMFIKEKYKTYKNVGK